jgi:hypothetical protein
MSKTTQITITEHNDHEGESFSYILDNVSEEIVIKLKDGLDEMVEEGTIEIEENSSYTKEQVTIINKKSKNGYMDRMGFYQIPDLADISKENYYDEIFYKAVGLEKIK